MSSSALGVEHKKSLGRAEFYVFVRLNRSTKRTYRSHLAHLHICMHSFSSWYWTTQATWSSRLIWEKVVNPVLQSCRPCCSLQLCQGMQRLLHANANRLNGDWPQSEKMETNSQSNIYHHIAYSAVKHEAWQRERCWIMTQRCYREQRGSRIL